MATEQHEDVLRSLLDAAVLRPSHAVFIQSYQHEVIEKSKRGELPLKRLASQTLAEASRSQYRSSERHLRALLTEACAQLPAFPETFARVLSVRAAGLVASFASARVVALRLSCVVLDAALQAPAQAWLPELLAAQSRLLEATVDDAPRSQLQARAALLKLLKKHGQTLLQAYVDVIAAAAPEEQHYQLWLVLSTSGLLATETQELLWKKYAFWAFESKKRTFVPLLKADARLKTMSYEQFEALILPPMAKMLKKAPDTVIEAVGALVHAASLDFGRYLGDVFQPLLISKLRAPKDDVRALAVALAGALARSFRQSEHMQQFVAAMSALLDGKHGLLAQFYQREVASAVLNDAADAAAAQMDASEVKEIAPTAIASLLKAVGKEAHEQTRHLGLLALGKWLALASTDELDAATVAGLKTGFKNKPETVVAGYLRALAVLCRTRANAVVPFADEVIAVIKESDKKPNVVHLDGVLAIAVAGAIASASSEMDARMAQEGVADLILSSTSFIQHSVRTVLSTVASTSRQGAVPEAPEVSALAALSRAIVWVLASQQSDASEAYSLLVELLCSSSLTVRQSAERAVETTYLSSLEHCSGLVVAFEKKLDALTTEEDSSIPHAGVLRRALRVLLPTAISEADDTKAQVFAPVLFLVHHPLLVTGKKADAFAREWQSIRRRFLLPSSAPAKDEDAEDDEAPSDAGRVDNFIEEHEEVKTAIVELLANPSAGKLYSTNPLQRLAAQRTLATLLEFAGNGEGEDLSLHDVIEELLAKRLDDEQIDALSEEDVFVCQTLFDELYEPKKEGEDEDNSSSRTKRGGRRGNDDEQWEQELREELERKKRAEQGAQKKEYTGEQKALLEQQQQVRRKVQETHRVVSTVLEAVNMLAATRPDELHPTLPYLLRSVRVLFTCPLFKSEASSALFALAKAICPKLLRTNYQDVASALRVALELNQLTSDKAKAAHIAEVESLFLRLLAEFMEYVFGFQFESETDFDADAPCNMIPPPTLHLLFPVLRDLLRFAPDLRRWVLPLFAVHARMIPDEEEEEVGDVAAQRLLRRDMLQLTLLLLSQQATGSALPITNPDLAPGKLLTSVCMGPELTAIEWAPLLGDDGLLSEEASARGEVLTALLNVVQSDEGGEEFRNAKPSSLLISRLYCCCFDSEEKNRALAKQVWDATGAKVTALFAGPLLVLLNHTHASVRESASLALADGMRLFPKSVTPLLNNLKTQFLGSQPKPTERKDEFGIPSVRRPGAQAAELDEDARTMYPRLGVALCLEKAAEVAGPEAMTSANTMALLTFVMEHGLGDPNSKVRSQMRKTGVQAVASLGGGANTAPLLEMFERFLETTAPPAASTVSTGKKAKVGTHLAAQEEEMLEQRKQALSIYDHQREGVVVCLGSLAKHMAPTDPKVSFIVDSLIEALSIPSESVQRSVATCLSPLMGAVKDRSTNILDDLLTRVTEGETFGERMGAAYGVSAVVKGLGISALKIHNIIPRLEEAMKAGGANARQGAMLVFECLSQRLGLLFEPYIIVILPVMLKCSADASPQVREAASHTAKGIMANLSAHGVKLVLPSLLGALEESAWRTKQSGIQILGSMAYCAPRQLGSCLPQVVPKLMAALTDSHPKVRDAGKSALRDVGSVVRNPEIATISKVLLDALEDPNRHTPEALQQLQSTSFQHSIDAPSLALVMPIITRGLKDRAGDAKKKAALIVGSMCSMINDATDLVPYMETVLPSLKTQLMDPIPEVRAVAAKALGKLVKGLGERHFADMLTWLLEAMKDDEVGPVERSGAAQGLCEVVVALGIERVERIMRDDILPLARHPKYSVREGVLWVMAFLPPALGKQFSMFLREALPIVVAGLSDEAESVRDVAMHSGHVVVNAHALSHTRDLLPSLEAGLFDDSWRIRQSSVMLLGDLMYRISGTRAVAVVSEDNEDDDDETSGSAAGDRAIIKLLGIQRRNAILASLYMIRSDTSAVVRQSALQVWKSVVANTPKTLRQILEALMNAIVSALSGDNMEKQTMAGRTLGEIVRKLGEHVLPEVVPILRAGLSPSLPTGRRQGACIGLAEVIDCCTKKQIEDYVDTLVNAVLDGVCDELPEVRASAAQAFDVLHKGIGYRAIDETVPMILERIHSSPSVEQQERALLGLQEILRVKSREVLPYLIPRLLVTPVTASAARAVSRVAQATGAVIHFQVERIFATFFAQYVENMLDEAKADAAKTKLADEIKRALRDVVLAVEAPGVHWLAIELCKYCESENALDRALAFELVGDFCSHAVVLYDDQAPHFLKQIVLHLNDQTDAVVRAASAALKGMNATTKPEQFAQHLDFIRQSINSMVSDARHRKGGVGDGEYLLPGLCIPKGLEPFLPSYQWALMNGSPELRQSAAAGLGELVELSSAAALRPYLIKLTGPLIRIAGDRFPGHVKAAILQTLETILTKGGVALKPFLPQLQTTFVKALNDTAVDVRARGASALSLLVTLSPRVEPLLAELTERLRTTTSGVREANLEAVASVVERVGDKLSAAGRSTLESALEEMLESSEDALRDGASKCLASCVASTASNGDLEAAQKQLLEYSLANVAVDDLQALPWPRRQSAAVFTALVLHKQLALLSADVTAPLTKTLLALAQDEQTAVRNHGLKAVGAVVKCQENVEDFAAMAPVLVEGVTHKNKDVIRGALTVVKLAAKRSPKQTRAHLTALVPAVFQLIKSNNMAVKLPAERTLLYLLEVQSRPETQAEYLRSGAADAKIIGEYARRVLSKLKADSGDESD